jgi:hypothetical protein
VDNSFASRRVTRVLEGIVAERGVPQANGSDVVLSRVRNWGQVRERMGRIIDKRVMGRR